MGRGGVKGKGGPTMDATHVHLLLNHVPVLATPLGLVLLAVARVRRSGELRGAALGMLLASALVAIPVYLTGEGAEERVEHLPGISEAAIERHEDAAGVGFAAVELLGATSLAALLLTRRSRPAGDRLVVAVLALSAVATGLLAWTANLGGQIRHTEIVSGAAVSAEARHGAGAAVAGEKDDD